MVKSYENLISNLVTFEEEIALIHSLKIVVQVINDKIITTLIINDTFEKIISDNNDNYMNALKYACEMAGKLELFFNDNIFVNELKCDIEML